MAIDNENKKVGRATTILRMESTSIELARVIARASTTIPIRFWSVGSKSVAPEDAVTSVCTGEGSGQGDGDDERVDFFPVFRRGFEVVCSSTSISAAESVEAVSILNFLKARTSAPPIDRRLTDVLMGSQVVSTSVNSDSGVDCLVSSSRIGDEERRVNGEERREGDDDRDLARDLVGDVDRFGVCGIDKVSPGLTGDGGMTAGTVATGSSSQPSGKSVCSEDMSSWTFSEPVTGEIGEATTLTASSPR